MYISAVRLALALLGVVLGTGAASVASVQSGGPLKDPDAREIASYRLNVEGLGRVMRATHAMIEQIKKDPRVQERISLEAELTALEKKEEPSAADTARIEELEARRETFEDVQPEALTQAKTLGAMEAAVKSYALLSVPLAKEGMSPREYSKFFLALIRASLAASLQKAGLLKELPADVSRENVQFVIEHEDELQRMQQDFEGLGGAIKGAGGLAS